MSLPIAKNVAAYRIVEQISEGGMAHLYRATDQRGSLDFALKVLKPEGVEIVKRRMSTRTVWEGEIAVALDHPHIVHTYEHGRWKDTYFIAMEMLDPFTLKYLLDNNSPLVQAHRYRLLHQIAQGLQYVHDEGYLHRDINPRNVLIDRKGIPKIIDMGLAIPIDVVTTCRDSRSGTPAYMAPEQVRGQVLDQRVDIYSFGATMYEVLTGRHPFATQGHRQKMAATLNVAALPPSRYDPAISQAVDELVLQAMAKDPNERFGGMKEILNLMTVLVPAKDTPKEPSQAGGYEDRRFVRVEERCFVRLMLRTMWILRREYRTVTRNISIDGVCCVNLPESLSKGQKLDMELTLRGEKTPLLVMGEVAWCRPSEGKRGFDAGIQFKNVPGSMRDRIARYLRARIGQQAGKV